MYKRQDESKAREMEQKMRKAQFGFDDYLESMNQMKKMGGLSSVLSMLPGVGGKMKDLESMVDEKDMARKEAMIYSMTPAERANPDLLNPSRKNRIAKGAGVSVAEVNRFVKQFEQTRKMMKQMPGMMKGKRGRLGAVSYTHLDVYKRQDHGSAAAVRSDRASERRKPEIRLLGQRDAESDAAPL